MTAVADVRITEFTDPTCPWAWSAEPFRRRLRWLYGDALEWETRMVGLSASAEEAGHGLTRDQVAARDRRISHEHRMPIDSRPRTRLAPSRPACRMVVAVRLHDPEALQRVLRELRVLHFSGEPLDELETLTAAAATAEIMPGKLDQWLADPMVEQALEEDMRLTREPLPAARVLDTALANWSGGRRYSCPSYEIMRLADGVRVAVPGFQPFAVYDVITANLVPDVDRRKPPSTVADALRWADCPLATQEVAVLCQIPFDDAREQLGRVADQHCVGADGFWTLRADGS